MTTADPSAVFMHNFLAPKFNTEERESVAAN